jgi:hypothetical protein
MKSLLFGGLVACVSMTAVALYALIFSATIEPERTKAAPVLSFH